MINVGLIQKLMALLSSEEGKKNIWYTHSYIVVGFKKSCTYFKQSHFKLSQIGII